MAIPASAIVYFFGLPFFELRFALAGTVGPCLLARAAPAIFRIWAAVIFDGAFNALLASEAMAGDVSTPVFLAPFFALFLAAMVGWFSLL
jgi:hypothetical protein